LFIFSQTVSSARSQTTAGSFRLGFVKSFDDYGDSIWLAKTPKEDRIESNAVARLGYGGLGRININGRDIELKAFKQYLPDTNFKVGRGGYQIWKGVGTVVRLDYLFTWLCPPNTESCEVFYYIGILDVTYKGRRRNVEINGFGGS
jgi:hypothetical protein